MIINIPTIKKTLKDNKVEKIRSEMEVSVDTSFLAHLKWEEHFQRTVGYDLATYTSIVSEWLKDDTKSKANLLGMLKLLYCYISSDKLPTFKDFCIMFDFEIADEILKKIAIVLEELNNTASKN